MAMELIRNPRVVKILKILGVGLFAVIAFVISIGYTLPEDRLKSLAESRAAEAGIMLSIDELDAGGFGSVTLSGVKIELAPVVSEAPDGSRIEMPRKIDLDLVEADIGLFATLFGSPTVTVRVEDGGGHLGPVHVKVTPEAFEIEIDEIENFPVPRGFPAGPFPLAGVLKRGGGRLLYSRTGGLSESEGAFELTAENVVALKPVLNTKQAGAIALTDIVMGRLEASIVVDKRSNIPALKKGRGRSAAGGDSRVIYVDKLKMNGKDIRAMVEGNSVIRLLGGRSMSRAQMTLELAFAISESFFNKKSRNSDDTPNKFLKTLLDLDPRWKSARSGDFYGLICTGTLTNPSCVPKKPSIRGGEFKLPAKEIEEEEQPVVEEDSAPAENPVRPTASRRSRAATRQVRINDREPSEDEQMESAEPEPSPDGERPRVSGDMPTRAVAPQSHRAGPRAIRGMDAVDRKVGGRILMDRAESMRSREDMRMQLNVRSQEPGEPTEE